MKIFVPIKRVPDYETKVKVNQNADGIQTEGIKWIVNPFDEIAVEEALKIKESRAGVEVVLLTIGEDGAVEQLRNALAMGADRAIHIVTSAYVDSELAAKALAAVYKQDSYGLIILGKQAIDSDANQTAQLLAAMLDLPQATFASKLVISEDAQSAEVTREVDGGLETLQVSLPAVISTDLRLNTPRYRTLANIVQAKKKPLQEITLESLGLTQAARVQIKKLSVPAGRKAGVKVDSVEQLVEKLRNEAKVI